MGKNMSGIRKLLYPQRMQPLFFKQGKYLLLAQMPSSDGNSYIPASIPFAGLFLMAALMAS